MRSQRAYKKFIVSSTCMSPSIGPGDILLYRPINRNTRLRVGDVVVVPHTQRKREYSVGRLQYVTPMRGGFVIRGDNQKESLTLPKSRIIGKVHCIKRDDTTITLDRFVETQNNLYLFELRNLCADFNQQSMKYAFMKGLPLWLAHTGKGPDRPYVDCDMVVYGNKNAYHNIFSEHGYYIQGNQGATDHNTQITYEKSIGSFKLCIDVHTIAFTPTLRSYNINAIYQTKTALSFTKYIVSTAIQKNGFCVISTHALTVVLLLHFFHHNWRGPHRLTLLIHLFNNYEGSKEALIRGVVTILNRFELSSYCATSLIFLRRLFPKTASLCDEILGSIRSPLLVKYCNMIPPTWVFTEDRSAFEAGVLRFFAGVAFSPRPIIARLGLLIDGRAWTYIVQSVFRTSAHHSP